MKNLRRFLPSAILSVFLLALIFIISPNSAKAQEEKTFTVTKRDINDQDAPIKNVGEADAFKEAAELTQSDEDWPYKAEYFITLNKDYDSQIQEVASFNATKVTIRSKEGNNFTFRCHADEYSLMSVIGKSNLTFENITFDGRDKNKFAFAADTTKVICNSGLVLKNFGPANPAAEITDFYIFELSGESQLTIKDGVSIENNKSGLSKGAFIRGAGSSTGNSQINIEGGNFKNNKSKAFGGLILSFGKINISAGNFEENEANHGGVISAYGPELKISGGNFKNNKAIASNSQGGAIQIGPKCSTNIDGASFENNKAVFGGAIFARPFLNNNGSLTIGENSKVTFKKNEAKKYGGAIFTSDNDYNSPADTGKYSKIKTGENCFFNGNVAGAGLFNPPTNYKDFTDLKYDPTSDVKHGILTRESLLNNYDVNYKNNIRLAVFKGNGGVLKKTPDKSWVSLSDDKATLTWEKDKDSEITLLAGPARADYEFLGWKIQDDAGSKLYEAGDTFTLTKNTIFIAQWKENIVKPQPKPNKPTEPILRIIKVDGDGNRINLPVTFKLTDKAYPSLPKTLVTDRDGQVAINSLSSGDYKLEEVVTPDGYAALDKPIEFSVVAGSAVRYEGKVVRYIYVTNDKKSDTVKEITGDNRQDVAAEVSKNYFADAKKVILVQDMAYADSMSAMNISKGKYPILYVGQDSLYDVTKKEILRTGRDEIIVMGGENTISKRLFEEIKALNHGKVTRVDGLDRFEVNKNSLKYFGDYNKAVIASGMIYTDALSSVPYAHGGNAPLLLTRKDSVPEIINPALKAADQAVLAGGPNTVSEMGKTAIESLVGKSVTRIDGADRYVVSAKLAAMVNKADSAILTSGEKWSDALIAGPLAQKLNAPVLLSAKNALPGAVKDYLTSHKDLKQILILGGPASIGEGVRSAVKALYK